MSADLRAQSHNPLYSAFGLLIFSEIPLPDLYLASHPEGSPDVIIRLSSALEEHPDEQPGFRVRGAEALLIVANVGRFRLVGGREIVVAPHPDVSPRDLRLFLLGSALGGILHQRGILPLHANAIKIGDGAVAFMGHSGAGKSTLAAWFHDRGYALIADDVCAVTTTDGVHQVQGGLPRLRLWRDALSATGREAEHYDQSYDGADKFDVPAHRVAADEAMPLKAIYLLEKGAAGDDSVSPSIEALAGAAAVAALSANTYRGAFAVQMGGVQDHLAACVALARSVPVFRVTRTWSLADFDRQARHLEEHALARRG